MNKRILITSLFTLCFLLTHHLQAQWVEFTEATDDWLSLGPDSEEKDIIVGDLNNDGLDDIIVARKNPFSNPGPREDLLLMHTGSALEDQTAQYAPEFLTNPTDARDVLLADFNGDGWLDVIFCNTFQDDPDLYINQGEDSDGNWLGLVDETTARIPLPLDISIVQFCAVWTGDVTGDGAIDIYLVNYNPGAVSQDVLLINDGNGFFTNETETRLGDLRNSAFGTSVEIHDMDNDGDQDIIKISTLYAVEPWNANGVFILFNDGTGHFSNWQQIYGNAPYMFTCGDFNKDGLQDVYVVDDGQDRQLIATEAIPDVSVTYVTSQVNDPRSTGFGGNCKLIDLDNDGDLDLGLADVDVDIPPCESGNTLRKFTMSMNDGGTLNALYGNDYYPWNESTYDFGFIDLNQDCYPDLFLGRCDGYVIFLNNANTEFEIVQVTGETEFCGGDSTLLDAGFAYQSYLWSTGATGRTTYASTSGTYYVTVTNELGCEGVDSIMVEAIQPDPTIAGVTQLCEGETTLLTASDGFISYVWSTNSTAQSVTVTDPGPYCVTVTDEMGCEGVECITLEEFPNYTVETEVTFCEGESIIIEGMEVDSSGVFEFNYLSEFGCDSTVVVVVTETSNPMLSNVTVQDDTGSGNGSIDLEITGGTPPYTYLWTNGEQTPMISNLTAGDYAVLVTDANGCVVQITVSVELNLSAFDRINEGIQWQVLPNPTSTGSWVEVAEFLPDAVVRIYDLKGQLLQEVPLNGQRIFVAGQVIPGLYLVELRQGGQVLGRRKLVVY